MEKLLRQIRNILREIRDLIAGIARHLTGGDNGGSSTNPPVFSGPIPDQTWPEDSAIAPFTVAPFFSDVTNYTIAGTLPPGVSFNPGTGTFSGTPTTPGVYTCTVTAVNSNGSTASNAFTKTVTVVVQNNGVFNVDPNSYNVNEADGTIEIFITRTGGADGVVSVDYVTQAQTATAGGTDYQGVSGNSVWNNGDSTPKSFTVTIINDSVVETLETFGVVLSNPTGGATLGTNAIGQVNIIDDDTATSVTVQFDNMSTFVVNEDVVGGSVAVPLMLSSAPVNAETATVTLTYGTASAADIGPASQVVNFPAGSNANQLATFNLTNDNIVEGTTPETFTITITSVSSGLTLGTVTVRNGEIIDDESYIMPLMDSALRSDLSACGVTNPNYVEMLNELAPYIDGTNSNSNDRNFFNYGGAVNPLAVFGPSGVPANWEANTKAFLLTELTNFPVTNRNTIRLSGGDMFLACICIRDWLPTFFTTTEWNTVVFPALEDIAHHLWIEHSPNGTGAFLSGDSDETNSWLEIAYYSTLILPPGSVLTEMETMFPNLLTWLRERIVLPDGTFGGGNGSESTTYMGQNGRYPSRILYILNKAGFNIVAGNWHEDYALLNSLLWLSDESGIWGYHDGDGIQTNRDDLTYPTNWRKAMSPTSERTGRWTDTPLLNTQGTPQHEALTYFMDNVIPSNHAGGRNSKVANWLFRDCTAGPSSLVSIANLPTSHNSSKRGIYAARKDWNTNAPQFFFNKMQFRQQDHCPVATYFEIWDDGVPFTHAASSTRTSDKSAPVSTMYIESFGGSGSAQEYFPFDAYPGAQGARSILYGQEDFGDFIPYGPEDILDFSDDVAANVVTENGERYWDDKAFNGKTEFLKTWNRTFRHDWDGITFIYDYISMDVTDFDDLTRRYTAHPEAGRENKLGNTFFNRKAMRLTRATNVPVLAGGWYGWSEHGKQSYYNMFTHHPMTMRVVNEKVDAPWAAWNHNDQWPITKVAHLQENFELANTSGFDNMDFMGIFAWGANGTAAPVGYTANDPGAAANHYGTAALHNGVKKVFMTSRDPLAPIAASVALTMPGLAPGVGTKFAGLNFATNVLWGITVSGDTVTVGPTTGGVAPNADGVLELTV